MKKLIVAMIGENEELALQHSIPSFFSACDHFVYIDGGSTDKTFDHILGLPSDKVTWQVHKFRHDYKGANGYQRNIYLQYLKDHFMGEWCLVLDPDEIVGNIQELVNSLKDGMFENDRGESFFDVVDLPMEHFIGNFSKTDNTVQTHYVKHRLFKITPDLAYPETEHCVLSSTNNEPLRVGVAEGTPIYHMGYARNLYVLRERLLNHLSKSEMHSKNYLLQWYHAHLMGWYPTRDFDVNSLPETIKDTFLINADYVYFKNRSTPQVNHFIDAIHWKQHFQPQNVLEAGCGMGVRVFAMQQVGLNAKGFDISSYAVHNNPFNLKPNMDLWVGDVTNFSLAPVYDLVIAYDLLEHVNYANIDKALDNLKACCSKHLLVSVPVLGDPNLDADSTHRIRESKQWWQQKLEDHGFMIYVVPDHFLYRHQLIIAEVIKK